MPFIRWTKQHIIARALGLRGRASVADEIIVPKIAHGGRHPTESNPVAVVRERIVKVAGIHVHGEPPLFAIADAKGFECLSLGLGERGKQERGENRNDRDDDQQFD